MKKLKEKGITLVALVVTIILLLILAGVTLTIALGENGLFKMASQSVEVSKDVAEEEKVKLAVSAAFLDGTGTLTKANVQKALENEFGTLEEGQLEGGDAGPWTFKGDRKTYTIGNGGDIQELKPKTVADLKAGDWVMYESSQGSIPCRVLYDTEYNTTNKKDNGVQIISADSLGSITFGSDVKSEMLNTIEELKNAFTILRTEAANYIKENNITEDIRCVGSRADFVSVEPNTGDHQCEEFCYLAYLKGGDPSTIPVIDGDDYYKEDYNQMKKCGITIPSNKQAYWLSSFTDDTYVDSSIFLGLYKDFGVVGNEDWMLDEDGGELLSLWCDDEETRALTAGIRPVIKLKPGVILSEGDGQTKDTAYVLSKE